MIWITGWRDGEGSCWSSVVSPQSSVRPPTSDFRLPTSDLGPSNFGLGPSVFLGLLRRTLFVPRLRMGVYLMVITPLSPFRSIGIKRLGVNLPEIIVMQYLTGKIFKILDLRLTSAFPCFSTSLRKILNTCELVGDACIRSGRKILILRRLPVSYCKIGTCMGRKGSRLRVCPLRLRGFYAF